MNNSNIYTDILNLISTKSQADDFIFQLDDVLDSLFNLKENTLKKLDRILSQELKEKILLICQKNKINLDNLKEMQNFLSDLKDYIKKLPIVDLQLGCKFDEKLEKKIISWFSNNLKQKVLLNFKEDKNIIGGAIVGYNGLYKDFSLKKLKAISYKL